MILNKRPYLIVPKLIVQPTWGGRYISELKDWDGLSFLKEKKNWSKLRAFQQDKTVN